MREERAAGYALHATLNARWGTSKKPVPLSLKQFLPSPKLHLTPEQEKKLEAAQQHAVFTILKNSLPKKKPNG